MEEKKDDVFEKDTEEKESTNQKAEKVFEDGKEVVNNLFKMDQPNEKLLPKLLSLFAKILYVVSLVPFVFVLFNLRFGFRNFLLSLLSAGVSFAQIFAIALIIQAVARILNAVEKKNS